jgi:16S rRNA (cytosine967-C5)-methyltransferase
MKVDAPREAAFRCIRDVNADDAYANLALPGILAAMGLSGRDAAFATELTYGTLRMRGLYDAVIQSTARRDPRTLDDPVRWSLWLGAHQALSMRVPPHAAVSETVDLARRHGGPRVAPLVNAVMRRIVERDLEQWSALVAPERTRDDMAIRHSHPQWVVKALAEALIADGRPTE